LDILRNPTSVKLLAAQIIKACDDYIAFKITEKQLKELKEQVQKCHKTAVNRICDNLIFLFMLHFVICNNIF